MTQYEHLKLEKNIIFETYMVQYVWIEFWKTNLHPNSNRRIHASHPPLKANDLFPWQQEDDWHRRL